MNKSDIVLNDAAATAVAHTFRHTGADENGVQWFTDMSQSNALGYWKISVQTSQPKPARVNDQAHGRTFKVKIGLHEPVLASVGTASSGYSPSPRVAYISRSFTEYILPEETSLLDRKHLFKMTHQLVTKSVVQELVEDLVQAR